MRLVVVKCQSQSKQRPNWEEPKGKQSKGIPGGSASVRSELFAPRVNAQHFFQQFSVYRYYLHNHDKLSALLYMWQISVTSLDSLFALSFAFIS